MTTTTKSASLIGQKETRLLLRDLQSESLLLVMVLLVLLGLALFAIGGELSDPVYGFLPGVMLYLLLIAVWFLRHMRLPYGTAAWVLVGGCIGVLLVLAVWSRFPSALYLLTWVVGLSALVLGVGASALVAAVCTLLLWLPVPGLPGDGALRLTTILGLWSTFGLMALTLRPLFTLLQWVWASYERSRQLLDEARDRQMQLKQALADLDDANLQLTRLNRLTQDLRREAEEARAAKEQFVANVSHELRTPLNMIVGFSEMILQSPKSYGRNLPPALLADLEVIRRNSQHLSSLIDDVLDLSQIEAGQMTLVKERLNLGEIIEAAAIAVRPLFASKNLYLRLDIPSALPAIFADRTRIREVLLNLLSNAGRFTESGGVEVRAWQEGGDVVVAVKDTGPGIAPEMRDRIFKPFQQLDTSLSRRYGGSGLGLSISRRFVELHGGQMWFESQVGAGTTFYFRLPVDPPARHDGSALRWLEPSWEFRERTRRPAVTPGPVAPRLVLCDPHDTLRRLVERHLEGAEVVTLTSLEQAAEELAREPAQALLVNSSQIEATLEHLAAPEALPHGVPAIVCAIPGPYDAAHALGSEDYLVKPVSREQLVAALDRLHLKGKTVLIVDDEPEAQRLFWRMLASTGRGYRILTAGDGCEALEIARVQLPDVILLDLIMPNMDGFQFLQIKSQDPALAEIPVILISARDPLGQPVTAKSVAITKGGGLSFGQILACLQALSGPLAEAAPVAQPAPATAPPG